MMTQDRRSATLRAIPLAVAVYLSGCVNTTLTIHGIFVTKPQLSVRDYTDITVEATGFPGQTLRYRATANRGRIVQDLDTNKVMRYYAPYTSRFPDQSGNLKLGDNISIRVSDDTRALDTTYAINLTGNTVVFKGAEGAGCSNTTGSDCNGPLLSGVVDETGISIRDQKPLTDSLNRQLQGSQPVISPDGRKIAFIVHPGNNTFSVAPGASAIFTLDAAGILQNLTGSQPEIGLNLDPTWSPFGNELAFSSDRNGNFDIYAMPTDQQGAVPTRITATPVNERYPSWNPNPTLRNIIAISAQAISDKSMGSPSSGDSPWNVFLYDRTQIKYTKQLSTLSQAGSKGADFALEPRWRSDGQWIAYTVRGPGDSVSSSAQRFQRVYVQDTATSLPFKLNPTEGNDPRVGESNPAWSPDGREIAYLRLQLDELGNPTTSQLYKGTPNLSKQSGQPTFGTSGPQSWQIPNQIPGLHLLSTNSRPVGGWAFDWR